MSVILCSTDCTSRPVLVPSCTPHQLPASRCAAHCLHARMAAAFAVPIRGAARVAPGRFTLFLHLLLVLLTVPFADARRPPGAVRILSAVTRQLRDRCEPLCPPFHPDCVAACMSPHCRDLVYASDPVRLPISLSACIRTRMPNPTRIAARGRRGRPGTRERLSCLRSRRAAG